MGEDNFIGKSTKTHNLDSGDFVSFSLDYKLSYAVVTRVDDRVIGISHLEYGFRHELFCNPNDIWVGKAEKNIALGYFKLIKSNFQQEIEKGGLTGAVYARKHHHLSAVIKNLNLDIDPNTAIRTPIQSPGTGVYVLSGVYSCFAQDLDHLEGLVVVPKLINNKPVKFSEADISRIMLDIYPDGFGNILPTRYSNLTETSLPLACIKAYEIPETAKELVINPKRLVYSGANWIIEH